MVLETNLEDATSVNVGELLADIELFAFLHHSRSLAISMCEPLKFDVRRQILLCCTLLVSI